MSAPDLDFDQVYRESPLVPWVIGEPQPLLVELESAGEIRGDVLDVGCGPGDNAVFLASRGYHVTGVDGSPTAIERARAKVADLDLEFEVADVTKLEGFEDRFDTVVDSALYHCLDDDEQRAYVAALHRACRGGATVHVFCQAEQVAGLPGPRVISEQNLRDTFAGGWRITRLRRADYTTVMTRDMLVRMTEQSLDEVRFDDSGRFLMPAWQLTAVRA
ncbi:class I SAM-dependent methyltransferase [Amycolatopsis sp. GM8]|uniref:class I SAM-dependent methyltransferase n=1 Tax=Amycolatopsis sp. GM8 TaxID=2896530 RepID=UPI001F28CD1C|nr:class I SAM-dependent methyltransferase [Amycolatopsis sp. GM8]